jgi:hypothetical protein
MGNENRYLLQAAFMGAAADLAMGDVGADRAERRIHAFPFQANPGTIEELNTLNESYNFFKRMIEAPPLASGGASITNAVIKSIDLVSSDQKRIKDNGPQPRTKTNLSRANIWLLTDGDDSIEMPRIIEEANKLDRKTKIIINIICFVKGNQSFAQFSEDAKKYPSLGNVTYRLIKLDELNSLLNHTASVDVVTNKAKAIYLGARLKISTSDILRLAETISLALFQNRSDSALVGRQLLATLKNPPNVSTQTIDAVGSGDWVKLVLNIIEASTAHLKSPAERASMLSGYLDVLSKGLGVESADLVASLTENDRKEVLNWLDAKTAK